MPRLTKLLSSPKMPDATDLAPPPCIGETAVRRTWIIAVQPGRVPEEKRPPDQSHAGITAFLREVMACRPEGTRFVIAQLSYSYDLWTQDGREWLAPQFERDFCAGCGGYIGAEPRDGRCACPMSL